MTAAKHSPSGSTGHPMDLLSQIVSLDAASSAHSHWNRHLDLADEVHARIWAWAALDPSEVRRFGERLVDGAAADDLLDLGGHALLAAAFHGIPKTAIPFEAWTSFRFSRGAFEGDECRVDIYGIEDEPLWPNDGQRIRTYWCFKAIAEKIATRHNPNQPILDTAEILGAYAGKLALGLVLLDHPVLDSNEWRELAVLVESIRIDSGVEEGSDHMAPSKPAPSL